MTIIQERPYQFHLQPHQNIDSKWPWIRAVFGRLGFCVMGLPVKDSSGLARVAGQFGKVDKQDLPHSIFPGPLGTSDACDMIPELVVWQAHAPATVEIFDSVDMLGKVAAQDPHLLDALFAECLKPSSHPTDSSWNFSMFRYQLPNSLAFRLSKDSDVLIEDRYFAPVYEIYRKYFLNSAFLSLVSLNPGEVLVADNLRLALRVKEGRVLEQPVRAWSRVFCGIPLSRGLGFLKKVAL